MITKRNFLKQFTGIVAAISVPSPRVTDGIDPTLFQPNNPLDYQTNPAPLERFAEELFDPIFHRIQRRAFERKRTMRALKTGDYGRSAAFLTHAERKERYHKWTHWMRYRGVYCPHKTCSELDIASFIQRKSTLSANIQELQEALHAFRSNSTQASSHS